MMISMTKKLFDKKLDDAWQLLRAKGVVAVDGSGKPAVEALFKMLRWFEKGELVIRKEVRA